MIEIVILKFSFGIWNEWNFIELFNFNFIINGKIKQKN